MDQLATRDQRNAPLASLASADFDRLAPHLKPMDLNKGEMLFRQGDLVDSVFFPLRGIISTNVMLEDGQSVEAAMTGPEGILNVIPALATGRSLHDSLVQGSGCGLTLRRDHLVQAMSESEGVRNMVFLSIELFAAYALQSLACINYHPTEARLCRWILMSRDHLQSDELPLTQEFLAEMLGVQRSTVTLTALSLQKAGLIGYRRGHIQILDAAGVEEASCECYGHIRARISQSFPGRMI